MTQTYNTTARALHWLVFALVLTALTVGWIMTDLPLSPTKLRVYSWHKWVGVTVLALFFVRLAWRLRHPAPPPLPMPAWQHRSAHALHGLLYLLMVVQPLTGWIYSNAAGFPVVYLGVLPLPNLVAKDHALAERFEDLHGAGATLFAILVALHALAALKHHFIDRDDTLRRMLPPRRG